MYNRNKFNLTIPEHNNDKYFPYKKLNNFLGLELRYTVDVDFSSSNIFEAKSTGISTYPNQFGKISELIKNNLIYEKLVSNLGNKEYIFTTYKKN